MTTSNGNADAAEVKALVAVVALEAELTDFVSKVRETWAAAAAAAWEARLRNYVWHNTEA